MSKNVINQQILAAQSMAASFSSDHLKLGLAKSFRINLQFAGTSPTGTFKLMFSSDLTNKAADVVNWDDVPDSDQAITEDGTHAWVVNLQLKWVKVVYTRDSGDGACNGQVHAVEEY